MKKSKHEQMKSELKKLLEALELSKDSRDPEQAQDMLDRIAKFRKDYGDEFEDALKESPDFLRELDDKLDSEEDRLKKIVRDPRQAAKHNFPDNQIKPGWTFTNEQMNYIEGVNLLQTDLSQEYNIRYADGSVTAKLEEQFPGGDEQEEETSYGAFRPPPPKDYDKDQEN